MVQRLVLLNQQTAPDDFKTWARQSGENILAGAGKGTDDGVKGGHCDVRTSKNGRAYLYYFVHPGIKNAGNSRFQKQRSSIQVVELKYLDGRIAYIAITS